MTTKSSIRNMKSRISTSNSVNSMSTNGSTESRSSRICIKRPLTTANFIANNSTTNGLTNQLKKRTLQINNFFNSKIKSNPSTTSFSSEQANGHLPTETSLTSTSPPLVFYAIAPTSTDEQDPHQTKSTNGRDKSDDVPKSPSSRRIAQVLARTHIKTMSTDCYSLEHQSSCSEVEDNQLDSFHPATSSLDADADESDNEWDPIPVKSRHFQKTKRSTHSSVPQKADTINPVPEQQISSSNDEGKSNANGRTKPGTIKKSGRSSLTTTDEDTTKAVHRYQPLINLQEVSLPTRATTTTTTQESSSSRNNGLGNSQQPAVKKINRFQVKPIRKSQQQIILAKSSNEDDCSVPNGKSNLPCQHTNTPTTDGEHSPMTGKHFVNGAATIENGHTHVHFHIPRPEKKDSIVEEEKPSNPTTLALPAPPTPHPPHSSAASAQGEDDDEEEEAVAKSPDGRFIKYAKEIGRGAFKTVYRGLDTETSVAVAWCELQEFAQFDKHERARFKEEAEMLKKLQHPNIVRFYDFWETTNPRTNKKVIILVTELMTSGSLKGYIRKFKRQNEERRINVMKKWCRQILKGLAYLHSRNPPVIHRDLKCDNVFVSSTTGCVKIGDLGLATFKTQTFAKSMHGTMEFMAPEMFDEQYDELVDLYSFGLCMLEMITDEYPYTECKGPTAVIKRVTAGCKPDCYYKVENEVVKEVIDCCIRTNKKERLPVQELLQHSFFLDDNGLRIGFVRDPANDSQIMVKDNSIGLKLKIVDKSKRKILWPEHDAVGFRYNFDNDTPEQIADELIKTKHIFDEDRKFVIQSIQDRLRAYQYEQIDRKAGVFFRNEKGALKKPSLLTQQQQQPQQPQVLQSILQHIPINPVPVQPQIVSAPQPTLAPPPTVEVQPAVKPSTDIPQAKHVVHTEPIPINQLSDLGSSVSGSAGSLEILDAALKKTFHKTNLPHSTSTITNENVESSTSLATQDDSSLVKLGSEQAAVLPDQPVKDESTAVTATTEDLANHLFPTTTPAALLQTQSQPSTMLTPHQQQTGQNSLLLTPTPQSYSYSATTPSPHLINTNPAATDSVVQQIKSASSSSIHPEPMENSQSAVSPSLVNESNQLAVTSDTPSTQPPISGSLKQLDALLKNTFKNPSKSTGTTQNSDTENTTPTISLTVHDDTSTTKLLEPETEVSQKKSFDLRQPSDSNLSVQSQPNTSSIILSRTISQIRSQPTSQVSPHFDPLISPVKSPVDELDQTAKSIQDKSLSNDDTLTVPSTSSTDLSEIKTMMMDLSRTFVNRMNIIENKIDEHRNQTTKINSLLTKTILPSILDLTEIIEQTPNLDSRVRTKLQTIQTTIRASQQQTEIKDLMDI